MNARQLQISERLGDGREHSVRALARQFHVTPMSIRRDLARLEAAGQVVRTHGGALLSRPGKIEFAFHQRHEANQAGKKAIAAAAAALVKPGMAISLDTGTTTLEVARAVAGTPDLKILTSSLAIAGTLYPHENVELVLLGGVARKGSPDLHGELTEMNLARFRVHRAFLGADAVSPAGCYTTDANVARVSRAMTASADKKVLVVDHSKFHNTAFVKFAGWADIDLVITDDGVDRATRRWLRRAAKNVIYARV